MKMRAKEEAPNKHANNPYKIPDAIMLQENAEPKSSEPASSTEGMLDRLLVQAHHVDVPASVWGSGLQPGPCLGLLFCFSSSGQEVSWHFKYRHLIPDRSNLLCELQNRVHPGRLGK